MENGDRASVERDVDGSSTEYFDLDVRGDRVERLMREIFVEHWERVTVGPLVQGAAWELCFSTQPRVSMLDGYLTVDGGQGHFHLITVLFPSPFYDDRLARLPEPDWSRTRLWNELRARFSA